MKKTRSTKPTTRKPTPTRKAATRPAPKTATRAATKATKKPAPKRAATSRATKPAPPRASKIGTSTRTAASRQIDAKLAALGDWRGALLGRLRALILEADPEVVEEVKWGGVPVWSHGGIITTGETYKAAVKLTFAKGASLPDPAKLFNASLEGNTRRAIDFPEGATIDEAAFKTLVRDAVAHNLSRRTR